MKKFYLTLVLALALGLCLGVIAFAQGGSSGYEIGSDSYTVYTDAQYQEVVFGIYEGTLENKTVVFGCNILVTLDFVMTNPCDITIDLNGFTYSNNTVNNKSGDFDFQNKDAIIRIKNGDISSNFCVFIFRTTGQLYAENINVESHDECVYRYGNGHNAVVNLKNCKMNATGNYYAVNLNGNCGYPQGNEGGSLYQIEGGEYGGLSILCPREGSYVKNCSVYEKNLCLDTWHMHAGTSQSPKNVELEVRNVVVTGDKGEVYLNDVGLSPILYDCTFQSVNLSNKTGAVIIAYTSPTCEKPATKTKYHNLTSVTVDEQYSIDNPAFGHEADLSEIQDLVYENGFINRGAYVCKCVRCGVDGVKEKEPSAAALISFVGISTSQTGDGICVGYSVDNNAISSYISFGKEFKYGVVAYAPLEGEENLEPIRNDLTGIDYTISAGLNGTYSAFEFVLKGFDDETVDSALVFGAYVYDGYEVNYINTEISENGIKITEDAYAKTVTYNQIAS